MLSGRSKGATVAQRRDNDKGTMVNRIIILISLMLAVFIIMASFIVYIPYWIITGKSSVKSNMVTHSIDLIIYYIL